MKATFYKPKFIWVDSRIKSFKSLELRYEDINNELEKNNAIVYYKCQLYNRIDDVIFREQYETVKDYCFTTNISYLAQPTIIIVPKGTRLVKVLHHTRFEFPQLNN